MGMELLTSTDTDRLHERASELLVNMEALRDELLVQDGAVRSLYPGWEGEAADAMYPLWRDWYNATRETSYTATHAGYTISRLANELAIAQLEYRRVVDDAEAAGYRVRDDGMLEQPPAGATEDPAETARRVDEFRLFIHRIEGALEEAEAADQRAADKLLDRYENEAMAEFLKTYGEKAEPLYSALGGGLTTAATGLESFANRPGIAAAERARALATARRYRALANSPVFRVANANVMKRVQALAIAGIPLNYMQNRAQGDDGGEATTKAVVSGATTIGVGVAAGTAALATATALAAAPVVAAGAAISIGLLGSGVGQALGNAIGPWVHKNFATPYIGPIAIPLMEDVQEFGDDMRSDFWSAVDDLTYHAKNFPEDFREAIMG